MTTNTNPLAALSEREVTELLNICCEAINEYGPLANGRVCQRITSPMRRALIALAETDPSWPSASPQEKLTWGVGCLLDQIEAVA